MKYTNLMESELIVVFWVVTPCRVVAGNDVSEELKDFVKTQKFTIEVFSAAINGSLRTSNVHFLTLLIYRHQIASVNV
jgi:hypothetical protein